MKGNKKGFMMTFLVLILFLLMLAEVVTFVTINITFNQISQNIQGASSTNNYARTLSASADSFDKASLQAALHTLYVYESNASLRKSNFITNFNASISSLMENSTLYNVTPNSIAANVINAKMGGLSLEYYNKTVPRIIGASSSSVLVNETKVDVFQQSPYTLSASYVENVQVNTSYGKFNYNIPVTATISLNNTQNLLAAQEGITKYIQFDSADNITNIIGNTYALSGNTVGFQYGLVVSVPTGQTCSTLNSYLPFTTAPFNKTEIIVTPDASSITNSICFAANNYGGLITTAIGSNTPTNPYLVYASGSSIINQLKTGEHVLLYGPGLDTLNISNLQKAAANGYYFASPYAMSYGDIASDSVLHQSQNGIFTLSNYDTQTGAFDGYTSNIVVSNTGLVSGNSITMVIWANRLGYGNQGTRGIMLSQGNTYIDTCWQGNVLFSSFTSGQTLTSGGGCPAANNWIQYVATYNGVATTLYLNGVPVATGTQTGNIAQYSVDIGQYSPGSYNFNGLISNVQIYNTSLSASQVQTLYQRGISGLPIANDGLVGWWPLNGNAKDYSGLNNNGIQTNVIYTLPANYVRDSIMINNHTTGLQPIPGLLLCNDNSDCANPAFPHLYTGMSSLKVDTSQVQVGNFNGASSYLSATVPQIATSAGQYNTVSFWMYWAGADTQMPFGFNQYDLYEPAGYFGFNTGNGDVYGISSSGLANKWIHVTAIFYNGPYTNNNKLYLNGQSQSLVQELGSANSGTATTNIHISGWGTDGSYLFGGQISNVQIYNIALSPTQVSQLYSEGINGVPVALANVVAWYPLNGNSNDYSGNSNNAANNNVGYTNLLTNYNTPGNNYVQGDSTQNSYQTELQTLGLINN